MTRLSSSTPGECFYPVSPQSYFVTHDSINNLFLIFISKCGDSISMASQRSIQRESAASWKEESSEAESISNLNGGAKQKGKRNQTNPNGARVGERGIRVHDARPKQITNSGETNAEHFTRHK